MIGSYVEKLNARICFGSGGGSGGGGSLSSVVCVNLHLLSGTPVNTADRICGTNYSGSNGGLTKSGPR
jgi:hypothetical protein